MSISDLLGLAGKSALVLGTGAGMGGAIALHLARAGCNVAALDSNADHAEAVAKEIRAIGRKAFAIQCDILDDAKLVDAINLASNKLDGLDIMVAIVGRATYARILDLTADDWDRDHRINLRYFFVAAKTVALDMIKRNRAGAITCLSSVRGIQGSPDHAAYGAAKAGLINLVKTMAIEWAPYGIRVNAIAPGAITTPAVPEKRERSEAIANSTVPMARIGHIDEVAKPLLFLVSEMATYITGHTMPVDGGWTAAFLFKGRPGGKPV